MTLNGLTFFSFPLQTTADQLLAVPAPAALKAYSSTCLLLALVVSCQSCKIPADQYGDEASATFLGKMRCSIVQVPSCIFLELSDAIWRTTTAFLVAAFVHDLMVVTVENYCAMTTDCRDPLRYMQQQLRRFS